MTVLRTGSTQKYAANWDKIFGGGKSKSPTAKKATRAKKKPAKKTSRKKRR